MSVLLSAQRYGTDGLWLVCFGSHDQGGGGGGRGWRLVLKRKENNLANSNSILKLIVGRSVLNC